MTWKEMQDEIILDIVKIVAADRSAQFIAGVVQWQGKLIARPVYWPSPFELVGDGGTTHGMSMMPEPPSDWRPVELRFVPKTDGVVSKDDMPIAYYVGNGSGNGVAFPARFHEGNIAWSHSEEVIEYVGDRLRSAGLLKLTLPAETKQ